MSKEESNPLGPHPGYLGCLARLRALVLASRKPSTPVTTWPFHSGVQRMAPKPSARGGRLSPICEARRQSSISGCAATFSVEGRGTEACA